MSASRSATPHNPWHGLLHAVAERLIPLFQIPGQSTEYARRAAREAIAAYRAESRADYASIGRILALSLATIAAIGQSADPDLPLAVQLRLLAKASALSRSAEQAERGMVQRRNLRSQLPDTEDYLIAPPDPETAAAGAPSPNFAAPGDTIPSAAVSATAVPKAPVPQATVPQAAVPEAAVPTAAVSAAAVPKPAAPQAPAARTREPTDDAILSQIDAAIAEARAVLPNIPADRRPPFAAMPAAFPPPSFRQVLRSQAPIGILHATR